MADGKQLDCPTCSGFGIAPGERLRAHSEGFSGECSDCSGTGRARCDGCREHPSDAPAVRDCDGELYCAGCAATFDADTAAYLATLCSAGVDHEAAKRDEAAWSAMRYVGLQVDEYEVLEIRNCACHSSLCRVISRTTEIQDGAGNVIYRAEVA